MFEKIPTSKDLIIAIFIAENLGVQTAFISWVTENNSEKLDTKKTGEETQNLEIQLNSENDLLKLQSWLIGLEAKTIFWDAKLAAHQLNLYNNQPKYVVDISLGLELGNFNNPSGKNLDNNSSNILPTAAFQNLGDLEKSLALLKYYNFLQEKLTLKVQNLWLNIESPLAFVLAKIEKLGAYINRNSLQEIDTQLKLKANGLQEDILQKFADTGLNLNSPAQLGIALKKLGYSLKETKTGKISTDRGVLEELLIKDEKHLIQPILDYRTVSKLSSTYTQSFLQILDENSRIHTQYNQLGSATGRISSSNPNLQNIPIRNPEYGPLIRSCFAADSGNLLICADYSQIELRLLAHFCGDEVLTEAFNLNQDIHQRTASEIFDVPIKEVTKNQRRLGKTLNFALVYQQGSFATAVQLGITQKEATAFINKYFARFSKVKPFIEITIANAKTNGFVETIFGRRRYFKNLNSEMVMLRKLDERAAFNAVLQGSNADLIKKAMILLNQKFQNEGLKANIILQVHDELVVEAEASIATKVAKIVEEIMELNQPLKVPILVEAGVGQNWRDGKS